MRPSALRLQLPRFDTGSSIMDLKQLECFVRVAELGSFTPGCNCHGYLAVGPEPAGAPA